MHNVQPYANGAPGASATGAAQGAPSVDPASHATYMASVQQWQNIMHEYMKSSGQPSTQFPHHMAASYAQMWAGSQQPLLGYTMPFPYGGVYNPFGMVNSSTPASGVPDGTMAQQAATPMPSATPTARPQLSMQEVQEMDLHDTEKPDAKRQKPGDEYSHEEAIVLAAVSAPPQQPIPVMIQPEPVQQPPQQQQPQPVVVEQRPPPPPVPIPQPIPQQPVQVQQPMQQQPMQQPQPQQPQPPMQQQQSPLQQPIQQPMQQPIQSTADSRPLPTDVSMPVRGLTTLASAPTEYWRQQATAALPTAKPPTSIDSHPSTTLPLDDKELKKQRRKQSNRESARRSRLRKQAETELLSKNVQRLAEETTTLRQGTEHTQAQVDKLISDKAKLIARVRELGGIVEPELETNEVPLPQPSSSGPSQSQVSSMGPMQGGASSSQVPGALAQAQSHATSQPLQQGQAAQSQLMQQAHAMQQQQQMHPLQMQAAAMMGQVLQAQQAQQQQQQQQVAPAGQHMVQGMAATQPLQTGAISSPSQVVAAQPVQAMPVMGMATQAMQQQQMQQQQQQSPQQQQQHQAMMAQQLHHLAQQQHTAHQQQLVAQQFQHTAHQQDLAHQAQQQFMQNPAMASMVQQQQAQAMHQQQLQAQQMAQPSQAELHQQEQMLQHQQHLQALQHHHHQQQHHHHLQQLQQQQVPSSQLSTSALDAMAAVADPLQQLLIPPQGLPQPGDDTQQGPSPAEAAGLLDVPALPDAIALAMQQSADALAADSKGPSEVQSQIPGADDTPSGSTNQSGSPSSHHQELQSDPQQVVLKLEPSFVEEPPQAA